MAAQGMSLEPNGGTAAEVLLNQAEVARMLGVGVRTLPTWRSRQGPSYVKVGKLVKYKPADIRAYIERRRIAVGQVPARTP